MVNLWDDAKRAANGILPIVDDPVPPNKDVIGSTLENDVGTIRRRWTLRDPPLVVISRRQFFQALALNGAITQEEALAAMQHGAVPASMEAFIDAMPNELDRFNATMILAGAIDFQREHPMVELFRTANAWSGEQVDELWRFAATL